MIYVKDGIKQDQAQESQQSGSDNVEEGTINRVVQHLGLESVENVVACYLKKKQRIELPFDFSGLIILLPRHLSATIKR